MTPTEKITNHRQEEKAKYPTPESSRAINGDGTPAMKIAEMEKDLEKHKKKFKPHQLNNGYLMLQGVAKQHFIEGYKLAISDVRVLIKDKLAFDWNNESLKEILEKLK